MNYLIPTALCDFYKISHRDGYPKGTEYIYSTWTPRGSRLSGINKTVVFGLQVFLKQYLSSFFNENFFGRTKEEVVAEYARFIKNTLGDQNPHTKHIEDLHDLGYLPLRVKALPEGMLVQLRTPVMTIENTDPRFFWLTNYIETLASCELWQASTSATLAFEFKKTLIKWAKITGGDLSFVPFQGHDFSMRGMSSLNSAILSGLGHLLSFTGTDTCPAIMAAEYYYNANIEKELVGTSIPAMEHSIQCAFESDFIYFKTTMTESYPNGFVSIVADGRDYWKVIGEIIPQLKDTIMNRNGKVVIRPDSGDPVKIVCGDPSAPVGSLEHKGTIEALWEIFGGTQTEKGFKLLDSHIGCIYGDAITIARAEEISQRLHDKGFASTNMVYGIGSYTYQYNTRDTFGYALKSTSATINGVETHIFKDPKTDNGVKKSQKGRVAVFPYGIDYAWIDGLNSNSIVPNDMFKTVFENGKVYVNEDFSIIRKRLESEL